MAIGNTSLMLLSINKNKKLIRLNFNNHYDNDFHNTFDYNLSIYRDYLLYTVTASVHIML